MEIKIVSDGTVMGTKVFDAVTGAELRNVESISWELNAASNDWNARVEMTLINVPMELRGKANVTVEDLVPSHEA